MSLRQWPQGKALLLVQAVVSDLLPIVQHRCSVNQFITATVLTSRLIADENGTK
jgi:hypothetical protein